MDSCTVSQQNRLHSHLLSTHRGKTVDQPVQPLQLFALRPGHFNPLPAVWVSFIRLCTVAECLARSLLRFHGADLAAFPLSIDSLLLDPQDNLPRPVGQP